MNRSDVLRFLAERILQQWWGCESVRVWDGADWAEARDRRRDGFRADIDIADARRILSFE